MYLSDKKIVQSQQILSLSSKNQKYALSLGKNIAKLEIDRMEAELKYKIGFLESIRKKLNNEKIYKQSSRKRNRYGTKKDVRCRKYYHFSER